MPRRHGKKDDKRAKKAVYPRKSDGSFPPAEKEERKRRKRRSRDEQHDIFGQSAHNIIYGARVK